MKTSIKKFLTVSLAVVLVVTTFMQTNFVYANAETDKSTTEAANTADQDVCSINGVGYTSLKEAFENAADGSTIVLEKDITNFKTEDIVTIPAGKKVVFNMAKHSITVDASGFEGRIFKNNGNLTITGDGVIDTTAAGTKGWGPVENFGTLTVENGTYKALKETNSVGIWNRAGGTAYFKGGTYEGFPTIIRTAYGSTTTISGGTYTNDCYPAIENDGDMKITGGVFTNTSCSACSGNWGYTVRNGIDGKNSHLVIEEAAEGSISITGVQGALANSCGLLEVKSGSFETVACKTHGSASAHYALYVAGERGDSKAIVTGGTFKSVSKTTVFIGNDNTNGDGGINANATTEIKGGTFIAPAGQKAVTGAPKTGNPYITGGTFKSGDTLSDMSEYMPSGMTQDESGKVIVKEDAVAEVNGAVYDTLKEAIDKAQAGSKITLLSDAEENITLNKDVIIDGEDKYTIKGLSTIKQGTLQNLTLTPDEENANGSFLTLGSGIETKINFENVTLKYSVTKRSAGSAVTVSGNKADITINNCLFTNEANNNGTTEDAEEWSYGLYINEQGDEGKITFTNNEFNGAFRTMLPNISGNMLIEGNKFINSVYSVANGPTGGSAGEATVITTSKSANNNLVVKDNVFDNAGAMFFQTQIQLEDNQIKFDKFEHYVQAGSAVGEKVDISDNRFEVGDNSLVIFDTANAPLILPAGQEAVSGWVFNDTPEDVRPSDYSEYKYMYNEDGTITFKPQSDVALDQFLNQAVGNITASNGDTILIEKNLKIDTVVIGANTNLTFEIKDGASLTINEKMDVSGTLKIVGDGKFIVKNGANVTIEEAGVVDISKNNKVENNGKIVNDGTLIIPDVVEGNGEIGGSGDVEKIHNPIKVDAKDSTCTEDGVIEHWYCKSCKKYYSDSELKNEIAKEDTIIVANGHEYDDRGKCTVCGAVTADRAEADKVDKLIDAIGPADKVTLDSKDAILAAKKAYNALTDEQKKLVTGLDELNAAIDAYNTLLADGKNPIDKPNKEGEKSPQTGDDANPMLILGMLLASAGAAAALRRKRTA